MDTTLIRPCPTLSDLVIRGVGGERVRERYPTIYIWYSARRKLVWYGKKWSSSRLENGQGWKLRWENFYFGCLFEEGSFLNKVLFFFFFIEDLFEGLMYSIRQRSKNFCFIKERCSLIKFLIKNEEEEDKEDSSSSCWRCLRYNLYWIVLDSREIMYSVGYEVRSNKVGIYWRKMCFD